MTLPKDVAEAMALLDSYWPGIPDAAWVDVRAHLLNQDAEIERLQCNADDYIEVIGDLVSRLAAADALLNEIHDAGFYRAKIDAHLQGAGDDDLSMLPEDVQGAVSVADQWAGTYEHGFSAKNAWATIRAELLRLARENAALQNTASRLMRENAELDSAVDELATLKARIEAAPTGQSLGSVVYYDDGQESAAARLEGKRVQILAEDGE